MLNNFGQSCYNCKSEMKFQALIINRQIAFLFSHQSKKKYFFKVQ